MEIIDYFKLQAKNLKRDYDDREFDGEIYHHKNPRFFKDIDDIIIYYDIDEEKPFKLMNAQHIIALLAGFKKWANIIHANKFQLELGKLLFENRTRYYDGMLRILSTVEDWNMYLNMNNLSDIDDESKLRIFKIVFLNDKSALD